MRPWPSILVALACLLAALLAPARLAAEDFCFECHGDPELAEDGVRIVDRRAYEQSVHAGLDCTDCHEASQADGFEIVPHALAEDATPTCLDCHDEFEVIEAQFADSVHAGAGLQAFDCTSCHNPHDMLGGRSELPRPQRVEMGNHACVRCHRDSVFRVVGRRDGSPPSSTHDWLPRLEKHARMRCVLCHTPMDRADMHTVLPREKAVRACDACHDVHAPMIAAYVPGREEDRASWITNPLVFEEAYVPGATTNRVVDGILLALMGLTVVATLGHGLLRLATRRKEGRYEVQKTYLYRKSTRIWHWMNAVFFLVLAVTGFRMHFGGCDRPFCSFELAFNVHNLAGAAYVGVGLFFLVSNIANGNIRNYLRFPEGFFDGVRRQARWYVWGVFRGEPHPFHPSEDRKFNPLQQLTYAVLMYVIVPLLMVTGVLLLFPGVVPQTVGPTPGTWWVATTHYLLAMGGILFLLAHVYLATMGDRVGYLISGMVTGWHKHHVAKDAATGPGEAA